MYKDENVFVVTPDTFASYNYGVTIMDFPYYLLENRGKFLNRNIVEGDSNFQQIIPYIIVKKGNRYLAYNRLNGSGEPRLHRKYSLGIGGHINDIDSPNCIINGMTRELNEELSYKALKPAKCIGIIKNFPDDTLTDHTGILFYLEITEGFIRESDKYKELWFTKEELVQNYSSFESWAKYTISRLGEIEKLFALRAYR